MQKPRWPAPRTILAFVIVVLIACVLTVFVIAGHDPYLVQDSVDWVRGIVGPGPVAAIENTFYQAADVYNRVHYNVTGDSSSWQLASTDPTADQSGPNRREWFSRRAARSDWKAGQRQMASRESCGVRSPWLPRVPSPPV